MLSSLRAAGLQAMPDIRPGPKVDIAVIAPVSRARTAAWRLSRGGRAHGGHGWALFEMRRTAFRGRLLQATTGPPACPCDGGGSGGIASAPERPPAWLAGLGSTELDSVAGLTPGTPAR